MKVLWVLFIVYMALMVLCSVLAALRFRVLDRSARIIVLLVFWSLFTEVTAFIVIRHQAQPNNHQVYNISCLVEWVLLCVYFNYACPSLRRRHLGWLLALLGLGFGLVNLVYIQDDTTMASNFLFFECAGILTLSSYALYEWLIVDDDDEKEHAVAQVQLRNNIHFWLPVIFIFNQTATLWSWAAFDAYMHAGQHLSQLLQQLLLLTGIITYLFLCWLLFRYPKMKASYV
jgi:hypothetical protein